MTKYISKSKNDLQAKIIFRFFAQYLSDGEIKLCIKDKDFGMKENQGNIISRVTSKA